jgi:hypothetical protein
MTVIVVVIDESKDSLIKRRAVFLRLDVNIVIFYRSPKSFYPDVVLCPAPAVHTDLHFRMLGAICIRTEVVVFLRQGVDAGEDAVGRLEAGAAVVPVYAKERVLGFLPGIKVVSISRICNRNGINLAIRMVIVPLQDVPGVIQNYPRGTQMVGDVVTLLDDLKERL